MQRRNMVDAETEGTAVAGIAKMIGIFVSVTALPDTAMDLFRTAALLNLTHMKQIAERPWLIERDYTARLGVGAVV
jgi:hypothetical protein